MLLIYQLLLTPTLVFSTIMNDYSQGKKNFDYDYYDDIIFPAKMGKESIRGSSEGPKDLCHLIPPSPMYCKCSDQMMDLTCFVFTEVARNDMVWDLFGDKSSIAKLKFISRPEESLTFVPNYAFEHLKNLQTLSFSHCRLSEVQSFAFARLPRLVGIELVNNKIGKLQEKSFAHLHSLVELILSENVLTKLKAGTFVDLPRLRVLFLDRNNISLIEDGVFSHMPDLSELELWGNRLTDINQKTFLGLGKLHHLDLSFNQIEKLPSNLFFNAPKLEEVKLEHNVISVIEDGAFNNLTNLIRLRLGSNHIVAIGDPSPFAHLPRLMTLDLRDNYLRSLSAKSIYSLANIHNASAYVHIEGNPFQCSCDLFWMANLMNSTQLTLFREELNSVKCILPSNTETTFFLLEVPWKELGCNHTKSATTSYKYEITSDDTNTKIPDEVNPTIPQTKQELSSRNIAKPSIDISDKTNLAVLIKPIIVQLIVALIATNLHHHLSP